MTSRPDPRGRFSDRVEDYIRYRPGYPGEVFDLLKSELGLGPGTVAADIGSGTGIFAEPLLREGAIVYGVEPNPEMRAAADRLLADSPNFHSVDGAAESTGLEPASVDLVTAAQAFHWFDIDKARAEFIRILRPGGHAVLVRNDRLTDASPFLAAYENLLRSASLDYEQVNHRNVDDARLRRFFGHAGYRRAAFPNSQRFDWQGLYGRALSSSYVPPEGHPQHPAFAESLRRLFDRHNDAGHVEFLYTTRVYYAPLCPTS